MIIRCNKHQRRGLTVIYALVILAVLTALMALASQNVVSARRVLRSRADQLQSQWLARGGLEMALEKMQGDPNYTGEVVELIADARVEIKVDKNDDGKVRFTCEARYTGLGATPSTTVVTKLKSPLAPKAP